MSTFALYLLLFLVVLCVLPSGAWAFGAGDIPDFAFLNDKAFRHGDIENVIAELAKAAGHSGLNLGSVLSGGGGLLGFAAGAVKAAASVAGGGKFTKDDVKKIYFGNWLRDYSQCMDIAGLSKLSADTLVMIVGVLGFMEFGYGTQEFEVTAQRLGVYLPVEHIDNPKGYAEKEGDARQWHKKLRSPVNPRELEVDDRTGMKNYMATEGQGWDTSTAFIRRSFTASIEHARRANGQDCPDLFEAYRLLGQGLHTLEDLMAHSNWVELSLRKLGHEEVFCHVGDNVTVNSPQGPVPPLVTGTFGGADFLHSLLGEGMDKLSQTSMTDVAAEMQASKNSDTETEFGKLKDLLGGFMSKSGGDSDAKMSKAEALKASSSAYNFDPDNVFSAEVQRQLKDTIIFHDELMRDIEEKLSMIPGLAELVEGLTNALNAYIYTLLAPYVTPILAQVSGALSEGSKEVIDSDDQYAVFNDPDASDPSHSMVSKDHFALILNEPAGRVARVIVQHSVNAMVQAWGGEGDPDQVIDGILEAFHHPFYATGNSVVQNAMSEEFQRWFGGLGPTDSQRVLAGLTKEAVREHKNKRLSEEEESQATKMSGLKYGHTCGGGYGGKGHSHGPTSGGYGSGNQSYGRPQQQQTYGGGNKQSSYGGRTEHSSGYGAGRTEESSYGSGGKSYGRSEETSYGGTHTSGRTEQSSYGGGGASYGRSEETGYGGTHKSEKPSYGGGGASYGRTEEASYGGSHRSEEPSYGRSHKSEEQSYGRSHKSEEQSYGGGGASYGRSEETSYGGGGGASYGRSEETSYGGGKSHGRSEETGYGGGGGKTYGRSGETSYGGSGGNKYGRSEETSYSGSGGGNTYGRTEQSSYGRSDETPVYGGGNAYGRTALSSESSHGRSEGHGHGGGGYGSRTEESSYGGGGYGGNTSGGYGARTEEGGYGRRAGGETYGVEGLSVRDQNEHGRRHKDDDDEDQGRHHRKKDSDDDKPHRRRKSDDEDDNHGRRYRRDD